MFDSRLAVPPAEYRKAADASTTDAGGIDPVSRGDREEQEAAGEEAEEEEAVCCQLCGGALEVLRHRNCANADCNDLIL